MSVNATFNGSSLQTYNGTNGIILQQVHHAGKNAKQAQTYAMSHANKSTIPYVEWPNKPITLIGEIVGTSIADCDNQIDTFNALLLAQNALLAFDYNGGSLNRVYTGTFTNVDVQRPDYLYHAAFTATLTATNAFGADSTVTTPSLTSPTGRTLSSYQDAITFGGNAPYQLPIVTITCTNPVSSSTNICTNPGFETNTTGWSSGGIGTFTRTTGQFHSGSAAGQMVNAASSPLSVPVANTYGWELYNMSGLSPGTVYTVSLWLKGNAGGESVGVESLTSSLTTTALTTSWQQVMFTFTASGTTDQLYVFSTTASATWFIDDVSIVANNSATISIGNDTTGQQVNVTRTWLPGDVLVVDTTQSTCTVNGTLVNSTGAFPVFASGAGTLDYLDNFVSRTFSIGVTYTKQWL